MKAKEIVNLSDAELDAKLKELKTELFNLRFRHASGQLDNPMQINVCKKDIARVNTVIRQRQLKG
ncbi:MAG: 50S ribosomal protein L29 [Clostridia bacterium]|nr:50S ribosomal protein L29 [Clostridia bacterium]